MTELVLANVLEHLSQHHDDAFSSDQQRDDYLAGVQEAIQTVQEHLVPNMTAEEYEAVFDAWLTEAQTQIRMAPTIAGFDHAQGRIAALLACHDTLFAFAVKRDFESTTPA